MSAPRTHVVVVSPDEGTATLVDRLLTMHGYHVEPAGGPADAVARVRATSAQVAIVDLRAGAEIGRPTAAALLAATPDVRLVLIGPEEGDAAFDGEPRIAHVDGGELSDGLAAVVKSSVKPPRPSGGSGFGHLVTASPKMRAVFHALRNAVDSKVTVLIQGESGTGKELVARAIHDLGPRRQGPFVAINCAGIPESLLEAELFGYERGAFTGATARKLGKFDIAQRGTLLLDEIGEMHPALQAKLLRVIQEGEYQRLGGTETLHADVRILSATHRNLEREVESGRFREDLYYRLAVFTVYLPPLRERQGDVPLLADHFVARFAEQEGKAIDGIAPAALELLDSYRYPGNVRELENIIAYGVVSSTGSQVTVDDLPPNFLQALTLMRRRRAEDADAVAGLTPVPGVITSAAAAQTPTPGPELVPAPHHPPPPSPPSHGSPIDPLSASDLAMVPATVDDFPSLQDVERQHILTALIVSGGNKAQAARLLGISRMTLYRKLQDLEIERDDDEGEA